MGDYWKAYVSEMSTAKGVRGSGFDGLMLTKACNL